MSTPSYPFQHVFQQNIWSPSCPNFIMFWPKGECLAYSSTSLPKLSINFPSLFHNISNTTWIAPSLNCKSPSMHVHTSHRPYGYPFFGNECIKTHDAIHDTFAAIMWVSLSSPKNVHVTPFNPEGLINPILSTKFSGGLLRTNPSRWPS
jgi:hypothetical protein